MSYLLEMYVGVEEAGEVGYKENGEVVMYEMDKGVKERLLSYKFNDEHLYYLLGWKWDQVASRDLLERTLREAVKDPLEYQWRLRRANEKRLAEFAQLYKKEGIEVQEEGGPLLNYVARDISPVYECGTIKYELSSEVSHDYDSNVTTRRRNVRDLYQVPDPAPFLELLLTFGSESYQQLLGEKSQNEELEW